MVSHSVGRAILCGFVWLTALWTGAGLAAQGFELLQLEGKYVKWGNPSFGTGAALTYAFVRDRVADPRAINCREMLPLDGLIARSAVDPDDFGSEVRRALDMWEAAANIRFRYVPDASDADLLIGAQAVPHGIAYTNISLGPGGTGAVASIKSARICFNATVVWNVTDEKTGYAIAHVTAHEVGHVIGLDHPGRAGSLMAFSYNPGVPKLTFGDIAGAVHIYGPPDKYE